MSSPTTLVYDLVPPRRPGIGDVGGGAKEDDAAFPPDPVTMPTAADENQQEGLFVAYGKVQPVLVVSVSCVGTTYSVESYAACSATLAIGDLSVTRNGTGDVTVAWPSGRMPARQNRPVALPSPPATGTPTPVLPMARYLTDSCEVFIFDMAGAAADGAFVLVVY